MRTAPTMARSDGSAGGPQAGSRSVGPAACRMKMRVAFKIGIGARVGSWAIQRITGGDFVMRLLLIQKSFELQDLIPSGFALHVRGSIVVFGDKVLAWSKLCVGLHVDQLLLLPWFPRVPNGLKFLSKLCPSGGCGGRCRCSLGLGLALAGLLERGFLGGGGRWGADESLS